MFGQMNYDKGIKLYNSGDYVNSIAKLQKAIQSRDLHDIEIAMAYILIGSSLSNTGNNNEAINAYNNAEKILSFVLENTSPSDSETISYASQFIFVARLKKKFALARDLFKNKRYDDATNVYDSILQSIDSNSAPELEDQIKSQYITPLIDNSLWHKGNCLYLLKKYDSAIETFKEVIKINPKFSRPYRDIADCYVELDMFDEASRYFTEAEEHSINEHEKIGIIYDKHFMFTYKLRKDKNYQSALDYAKSIPEESNKVLLLKQLLIGRAYFYLENYDEVLNYLLPHVNVDRKLDIIENNSKRGMANTYIGGAYYKQKNYETALKYLKICSDIDYTATADPWVFMGECYIELGEYEKAIEALNKAIQTVREFDTYDIPYLESRINFAEEKMKSDAH